MQITTTDKIILYYNKFLFYYFFFNLQKDNIGMKIYYLNNILYSVIIYIPTICYEWNF